jgi:membrane associated rhomboid family serine protease
MVQRKTAILTALVLIHLAGINPEQVAASASSAWHTHLIYMFFHGNALHLAINGYALWHCFSEWKYMLAAYIISVISSFPVTEPVIGASSIICAIWGMTMIRLDKNRWAQAIVIFTASFFIPFISWSTHIQCFALGFIYELANRQTHDYRKITNRK